MIAALRDYRADLHIHTVLSPCADRRMTPPAIVEAAIKSGLSMVAICDHNSAANAQAVQQAAQGRLTVLAGLEIASVEEVHVLGIFGDVTDAMEVGRQVQATLPPSRRSDAKHFGQQWIMDYRGKVLAKEKCLLACSCHFDLSQVVKLITNCNGLAVASHVDRPAFSVFSQLGFVPENVKFDALEISPQALRQGKSVPEGSPRGVPVLASSDSHFLDDIGSTGTVLRMKSPTFDELRMALKGRNGREVFGRYCA